MSVKKRISDIRAVIEQLGFTCDDIAQKRKHLCCEITDDEGHHFKAFTGMTPGPKNLRASLLNFKQDVRRLSNRAKGLIDD